MLSEDQTLAASEFTKFILDPNKKEFTITGFAGTGKSHLVLHLLAKLESIYSIQQAITDVSSNVPKLSDMPVILTATTNEAASVLSDFTNKPVVTIHSLLGLKVKNDCTTGGTKLVKANDNVVFNSIILIDEASYVGKNLRNMILKYTSGCKIIYIGDSYQLVEVGQNSSPVFEDVAEVANLTTIHRYDANSDVAELSRLYREAIDTDVFPKFTLRGNNVFKISKQGFKEACESQEFIKNSNNQDLPNLIVGWTNKKVCEYSNYINLHHFNTEKFCEGQTVVNNATLTLPNRNMTIKTGERCTIKNIGTEIFNFHGIDYREVSLSRYSESVRVPESDHQLKSILKQKVKAKEWHTYFKIKDFFADFRLPYSSTVYKAQGSTYNNVYIDLADIGKCNNSTNVARMLYVGISRAKGNVYLYGDLPKKYGSIE